jgi:site-specific recombinase XerD
LNRFQTTRVIRRLTRAADIDKSISPHSLRHTAVTLALDAGVPLPEVLDMAGHADLRTTRRHDRARMSLDRHATYTLASYLS